MATSKKWELPTIWDQIAHHLSALFMVTIVAGILVCQLILSPLRLVSLKYYRIIESAAVQWGMIVYTIFNIYTGGRRFELVLSGDDIRDYNVDNALVFSNHTCTIDWVINLHFACKYWAARKVRFFMKREHLKLPVIGYAAFLHDMIFLKRNDTESDRKTISSKLESLRNTDSPLWLWLYPEGTYITPSRKSTLEKVQAYAKKNNHRVLNNVLTPRTGAFQLCLTPENREHFDSIIDITMAFPEPYKTKLGQSLQPTMVETQKMMFGEAPLDIHYHIRRFDVKDVPTSDEGLSKWLNDRFEEKEDLLERFAEDGEFVHDKDSYKLYEPFYFYLIFWVTSLLVFLAVPLIYRKFPKSLFATVIVLNIVITIVRYYDGLQGQAKVKALADNNIKKKNQ